ncbi:hypothetical protein, partial [Thiolapillus sp.]
KRGKGDIVVFLPVEEYQRLKEVDRMVASSDVAKLPRSPISSPPIPRYPISRYPISRHPISGEREAFSSLSMLGSNETY